MRLPSLSPDQHELVMELSHRLGAIPGVLAVVLGGSHARRLARPGSDLDLGILYSEAAPFDLERVRRIGRDVDDGFDPVVTGFGAWGRWVNGGAWLTVRGQRVDFLYRSVERYETTIDDAEAVRYEIDWAQQPPFGFFSGTYLGEIATCVPFVDPAGRVAALKRRVATYPEALRRAVVRDALWSAEFNLGAFAPKFAAAGDAWGTAGCLSRAVHQLVLALFALNRAYLVNDKSALVEIAGFELAPADFAARVQRVFATPGEGAVVEVAALYRETAALWRDGASPGFVG